MGDVVTLPLYCGASGAALLQPATKALRRYGAPVPGAKTSEFRKLGSFGRILNSIVPRPGLQRQG